MKIKNVKYFEIKALVPLLFTVVIKSSLLTLTEHSKKNAINCLYNDVMSQVRNVYFFRAQLTSVLDSCSSLTCKEKQSFFFLF